MVLDYSKWDALELSDDSDFEPHPNVDKRSFIRAKQNQIHQQRFDRRHQIETLKYERVINDGLLRRIDTLLAELRSHEADAKDPNQFLYQALITSAGDPDDDEPPKPPEGVHTQTEQPKYSQMMASLVDQVKKEVDESKPDHQFKGYMKGIDGHKRKVADLQKELLQKLGELEKEEGRKITSDSIHDGFNSSIVSKDKGKSSKSQKPQAEAVEVLNPAALKKDTLKRQDSAISSGAEADVEEAGGGPGEDDGIQEATAAGKRFAKIRLGDYRKCLQFINDNRDVVAERNTEGLLLEGFRAEEKGQSEYAKQCVHQALLLQYCRSLGKDGVGLFFKRISTPGHQSSQMFLDDVNQTYSRMKERAAVLAKEHAAESAGVEQIQLQAVEPGTQININVPQPDSSDPTEQTARSVFETFPPGLQRALESGSLDRVNEVLGKMSVDEAEEVVEKLGSNDMLSMEQGVIDGTTEEGQERIRQLEKKAELEKQANANGETTGTVDEVEIADPD